MTPRRTQPSGQHEKINIDSAETFAQDPFVVTDLVVDNFPGLAQSPNSTFLGARLFNGRIGETGPGNS